MKKKILFLILICLIFVITLTGCGNKGEEYYVNLLNDYLKEFESFNNKKFPAVYSKLDHKLLPIGTDGNISNVLYDLDADQEYDILKFDFEDERIDATLLEFNDDEIKEVDSKSFLEYLPNLDEFNIICFAIKLNDKPYFFLEINGSSSLLADGEYYDLRSLTIDDDKIVVSSPVHYEASAIYEIEKNDYLNKVKRFGLNASNIDESIFSQNDKAVKVFEITRKHLEDFTDDSVSKYDDNIQYGETTFNDDLYEEYIVELENVKATINTDNMEYEFKSSNLGHYTYLNSTNKDLITFELNKEGHKYNYILLYYPKNSVHASEELWGEWDITKTEFTLNNASTSNLADYKVKNIKYLEGSISFDIELVKLINDQYKDYVIPNGTYELKKQ